MTVRLSLSRRRKMPMAGLGPCSCSLMLAFFYSIWLVSLTTIVRAETTDSCPLQCLHNTTCVWGEGDYSQHQNLTSLNQTQSPKVHCDCPSQWTGILCEIPYETCDDGVNKCYHGGRCTNVKTDVYGNDHLVCDCSTAIDSTTTQQYVGKYCEASPVQYCNSDNTVFCLNGGTCNTTAAAAAANKYCDCPTEYRGDYCEYETNAVQQSCTISCDNGGQCVLGQRPLSKIDAFWLTPDDLNATMYCACRSGFEGLYCEIPSQPCGDHACFHGGACLERQVDGTTLHHCDCTTSYTSETSYAGRYCQYKATTFCSKDEGLNGHLFCVNHGTCKSNPYEGCECPTGYSGFSCEFRTEDFEPSGGGGGNSSVIASTVDPASTRVCDMQCLNGGTCRNGPKDLSGQLQDIAQTAPYLNETVDDVSFMHCVCPDKWTGLSCEIAVDRCGSDQQVCLHGSTCIVPEGGQISDGFCDCRTANASIYGSTFTGLYCEQTVRDICTIGSVNPGQAVAFCVNGGTCKDYVAAGEVHPGCNCPDQFTGPHCEVSKNSIPNAFATVPPNTNTATSSDKPADSSSSKSAGKKVVIIFVVIGAVGAVLFVGIRYASRRQRRHKTLEDGLRWASPGGYRDRPAKEFTNLAPRRSTVDWSSSSSDPFAKHLSKTKPLKKPLSELENEGMDDLDEDAPQVYIGPPRDEDGHELHNVNII